MRALSIRLEHSDAEVPRLESKCYKLQAQVTALSTTMSEIEQSHKREVLMLRQQLNEANAAQEKAQVRTLTHSCIHSLTHSLTPARPPARPHVARVCVHACTHARKRACAPRTCMCARTQACACAHAHALARTHACTHSLQNDQLQLETKWKIAEQKLALRSSDGVPQWRGASPSLATRSCTTVARCVLL